MGDDDPIPRREHGDNHPGPLQATDEEILESISEADSSSINGYPTFQDVADVSALGISRMNKRLRRLEARGEVDIHMSIVPDKPGNVATVERTDETNP
jgi:DNA-binding MarR family transcriptional regulator